MAIALLRSTNYCRRRLIVEALAEIESPTKRSKLILRSERGYSTDDPASDES